MLLSANVIKHQGVEIFLPGEPSERSLLPALDLRRRASEIDDDQQWRHLQVVGRIR